jgi:type IV pilus assembly protein PilC
MQMSSILTNPVVVGLTVFFLVGLIVAVNVMGRNEKGRYALDYIKFNFPFINQIIRISIVTRFCRSFATLVNSGVPMMKTLELVGSASGSMVVARVMQKLAGDIKEGDSVSRAMKKTGIFPDLVIQMVSVGEEAGNIAELLGRTGDYFQQELDAAIESVMSLLEPVMMVIVGIIVGLFVMGILLPVLGITAKFGG